MQWIAPSEKDVANHALEKRLWDAADQLRANSGLNAHLLLPRLLSGQVPLDVSSDAAEPIDPTPRPCETEFVRDEPALRVAEDAPAKSS